MCKWEVNFTDLSGNEGTTKCIEFYHLDGVESDGLGGYKVGETSVQTTNLLSGNVDTDGVGCNAGQ